MFSIVSFIATKENFSRFLHANIKVFLFVQWMQLNNMCVKRNVWSCWVGVMVTTCKRVFHLRKALKKNFCVTEKAFAIELNCCEIIFSFVLIIFVLCLYACFCRYYLLAVMIVLGVFLLGVCKQKIVCDIVKTRLCMCVCVVWTKNTCFSTIAFDWMKNNNQVK